MLLETANIKLASVASDVFGVSGQAMLNALIEGNASPEEMAGLAKGRLRRKHDDLVPALEGQGRATPPLFAGHAASPARSGRTGHQSSRPAHRRGLGPYSLQHALLMEIPGVDSVVAAALIAEIGVDMSVFSASIIWRPGQASVLATMRARASRSGPSRKGNIHLRTMLVGAAISASRTKGSYLKDNFYRLKARCGALRAALAIANKILLAAYHMLAKRLGYRDLGEACLDQINQSRTAANLKRRLERLGYIVQLLPKEAAAV